MRRVAIVKKCIFVIELLQLFQKGSYMQLLIFFSPSVASIRDGTLYTIQPIAIHGFHAREYLNIMLMIFSSTFVYLVTRVTNHIRYRSATDIFPHDPISNQN